MQASGSWCGLRHAAAVFLGFTAFYTLFFAPVLFAGRLMMAGGDAYLYHYPAVFGGRSLWQPLLFSGYPRLADPQQMLWYPLALPLSLTGWEWLWNPFLLAPFILGSSFTYGLVWRHTRSRLGAVAAGLIFGLSGFMMAHLPHVAIVHGAAWLPLLLWSVEELRHRVSRRWVATLAIAVACCLLAGHVQIFAYSLLLCGLYVAFHLVRAPVGWWRYGLTCTGGVVLGLALTAVQVLPTAELIPHSQRARLSFAEFASFSFPKRQLPHLVFPYVYGGADPYPGSLPDGQAGALPYFGAWNFHELAGFCGLLSCVLAGAGFLGGLRSRRTWFWAFAGLAGVVLALGDSTPVARLLYRVPLLNQFRCPCRFLLWLELATAVLAGFGVAALRSLSRQRATLVLLAAATVIVAGTGVAWWKVTRQMAEADLFRDAPSWLPAAVRSPVPWENVALGLPLAGLLVGLVLLWLWHFRPRRATSAALLAAVVLDLGLFAWFADWRPASFAPGALRRTPEPLAALLKDLGGSRERILAMAPVIPSLRQRWDYEKLAQFEAALVNTSALWGVPNAFGSTPLGLQRYTSLVLGSWPFHGGKLDELLAIRYFMSPVHTRVAHGVEWEEVPLDGPVLGPGGAAEVAYEVHPAEATRVALVADLGCAVGLADGTTIAELTALTPSGPLPPVTLRMGEHLVEHCWERADVRPLVGHRLPQLTEAHPSTDAAGQPYRVHHSVAFVELPQRTTVTGLRFRRVGPEQPGLRLLRLTLLDDATGRHSPVHHLAASTGPWRIRGALADQSHLILENRRPLRRAWLVSQLVQLPQQEAVEAAIRDGKLPDSSTFEPYRTALVEQAVPFTGSDLGPDAAAQVTRHEPRRVVVKTSAASEAFLVLGDVYYPGWRVRIDGRPTHIYRTDSVLRGVVVPPGKHVVEFVYRPRSLAHGLAITAVAGVLLLGLLAWRRRTTALALA